MKKRICAFALAAIFSLAIFAGCSNGEKNDANISQADFFKLAISQRFDYVPLFAEGKEPANSSDYLMYAFIMDEKNLKEQSVDTNVKMSREHVDTVVKEHFNVSELQHKSQLHTWNYDAATGEYTAVGSGYSMEPPYKLITSSSSQKNGKTVYTVTATPLDIDELYTTSSIYDEMDMKNADVSEGMKTLRTILDDNSLYKDGMTYYDAIVAVMEAGKGDELPLTQRTDTFMYYMDGDNAIFLAHDVVFEQPVLDNASEGN